MNPDNWKAYLGFAGGALVFLAAVINILNTHYSRLGNEDQRAKFWFVLLNTFIYASFVVGTYVNLFTKSPIGMIILGISVIGWSIQFLRFPEPANRMEILLLVWAVSALIFGIFAHFISSIVDILGKIPKAA